MNTIFYQCRKHAKKMVFSTPLLCKEGQEEVEKWAGNIEGFGSGAPGKILPHPTSPYKGEEPNNPPFRLSESFPNFFSGIHLVFFGWIPANNLPE